MDPKKLMNVALLAGEIMLRNGAETYRVEDTINRILKTSHYEVVESFVLPTGLFATLDDPSINLLTKISRIRHRTIHLHKVALANAISRKYCNDEITLDEAHSQLLLVMKEPEYPVPIMVLAIGFASFSFALVFGYHLVDACIALVVGCLFALMQNFFRKQEVSKFFIDIAGGLLIASFTIFVYKVFQIQRPVDGVIIASIMPLVPGVAITNAIRDSIQGDLVSGAARLLDAFLIAASIAVGVGIVLSVYTTFLGGVL